MPIKVMFTLDYSQCEIALCLKKNSEQTLTKKILHAKKSEPSPELSVNNIFVGGGLAWMWMAAD